jgi:hypothetical protein
MSTKISSKKLIPVPRTARRITAKNGATNGQHGVAQTTKSRTSLQQLLDSIVERGHRIPQEELAQVPRDFAMNLEHYIY